VVPYSLGTDPDLNNLRLVVHIYIGYLKVIYHIPEEAKVLRYPIPHDITQYQYSSLTIFGGTLQVQTIVPED
jgi:hypothetical protein